MLKPLRVLEFWGRNAWWFQNGALDICGKMGMPGATQTPTRLHCNLSREPTNKKACAVMPISKNNQNSRIDVSRIVFNATGSKFMTNLKQFWPNEPPSRHLPDDAFIQAKSSFLSESAPFLYFVYRSTCKHRIGYSRLTEAPKHISTCIIHKHIFICRKYTDDRSIVRESRREREREEEKKMQPLCKRHILQ